MKIDPKHLWLLLPLVFLASCGDEESPENSGNPSDPPDQTNQPDPSDFNARVEQFYAENAEFFKFKTLDDLPDNLKWENGAELEEFGSPNAKKGGTLNFFLSDFPRTLRLVGPEASMGFRSYMLDYNGSPEGMGFTVRHPNTPGHFPCLAREWAVGEDGKTVYYRLDPEARYSDGESVKATDYFFLFYMMRSPHIEAPWYNDYYKTKYKEIAKYDELTVSVTFSEAKPDILYRTALKPVPQHFYAEFGEDWKERYNWRFEPTTGPYEILDENIKKGRSITLTKVKDWWLDGRKFYRYRYNVDAIHLVEINEPAKAFEVFKQGDIDIHGLSLPEFWHDKLPDDNPLVQNGYLEKITFYNQEPGPDWALRVNSRKPPLDNLDVRIGLQHSLDWELVLDEVFYGDYVRMEGFDQGYGDFSLPGLKARSFDPAKAKEHFAKAGYTQMSPDGILTNAQGDRLSVSVSTGYKRLEEVLTVLQQAARKAGIEFQPEILEQTAGWKKTAEKKHQIALSARNRGVEMYPRYWEYFHSYHAVKEDGSLKPNTNNDTSTALPDLDKLIDAYRGSADKAEMIELSHQIAQIVHDYAAYIPGWKRPFYRVGKWRWLKFPEETFDARTSGDFEQMGVYWIDEEVKKETQEAMKSGKTFPPVIKEYTTWKED